MKFANVTKRLVACGLAFALVVTGSGFQTGTASAAKKKKAAKATKVTVTVGKTKTIKVKKATKKVKWTIDKKGKKVVKITKQKGKKKDKAVIKGLKKGTATITAKYGKKSQKWKVTVKKATTNISSVNVDSLDTSCLIVKLKKEKPVNVSDLSIGLKEWSEGTYNYQATVKTLTTTDQITYRIYLSTQIENGAWINLKIGKDAKAVQYKQEIEAASEDMMYESIEKDSTFSYSCYKYFNSNTIIGNGKFAVKEGSLPEGVILNAKRGIIKGIPTVTGPTSVTLQVTDELGRTATAAVTFMVYDKNVIVSEPQKEEVRLDDYVEERLKETTTNKVGKTIYQSITIAPKGGSGSYTFTLTNPRLQGERLSTDSVDPLNPANVTKTAAKSTKLYLPYELPEGAYEYQITVTDQVNPAITTTATVTVNAVKYYNVKGNAKDVNSAFLAGNDLYFIPSDATSFSKHVGSVYFSKRTIYDDDEYNDYKDSDFFGNTSGDKFYYYFTWSETASVGTLDNATEFGEKRGTYAAELPAGEYIVKVYSPADDILYEMNDRVQIGATETNILDVSAPVRFFSVTGVAQYSNGNPVAGDENNPDKNRIYFETKDEQYENYYKYADFYVTPDKSGTFTASLPANTYVAYIYDEKGQRRYFNTDIAITDQDITLNDFKLSIARYIVSGRAIDGRDGGSNPFKLKYLYFIDSEGYETSVRTDENGAYDVLLPTGTYIVKTTLSDGDRHKIGEEVTVTDANVTADLVYTFANETLGAQPMTLGSILTIPSTGYSDLFAQLTVTETATYQISVTTTSSVDSWNFAIYNADGEEMTWSRTVTPTSYIATCTLTAGTYFIKAVPENDDEVQLIGNFNFLAQKSAD